MTELTPLRLHHVGYSVKEIEAISENYIGCFGYEAATGIILDPLQTALVQFLKLPGDQSYLEFVAPASAESVLSAAATKRGGLNHLCYTSGPIEAAIASLEERGLTLISEPKPAVAFNGRRICWMIGEDPVPIELVERRSDDDLCVPGL